MQHFLTNVTVQGSATTFHNQLPVSMLRLIVSECPVLSKSLLPVMWQMFGPEKTFAHFTQVVLTGVKNGNKWSDGPNNYTRLLEKGGSRSVSNQTL